MNEIMALITARGGSAGVPGKNIAQVAGKPLIAWTIQASLSTAAVQRTIVSTDDGRIADIATDWGAEVPFRRPGELAQSGSPHVPVALHALDWLEANEAYIPDYLVLLQPTSPLRTAEDIINAISLAKAKDADAVVSVCPARDHPYLVKQQTEDGRLENFIETDLAYQRRQALPPALVLNGAIYVIRPRALREYESFVPPGSYPYIMPAERSLEVDEPWDLHLVRLIMEDRAWPSTLPDEKWDRGIPVSSSRKRA